MTIVRCEECSPAEDKEETRCGVWSPEECEIHQSGRGDLLGWKGMPQEELAVICGRKEKKKVQKSRWDFTPRRTEAGVFISARLAWIFIPAVNVF